MGIGEWKTNYLKRVQEMYTDFPQHAEKIIKACEFAINAHHGQVRKYEDAPFVAHPMSVSLLVAERYQDIDLIIAALLHDAAEDCEDVPMSMIYDEFGESVGYIVDGVSKEPLYFHRTPQTVFADKIEKLLCGGMQDIRVILLKLVDREHNLTTLGEMTPHKQIKMAFETQAIYEPLKNILFSRNKDKTIAGLQEKLTNYLKNHHLSHVEWLKHSLFSMMYHNLDDESYALTYGAANMIVRQIENKKWFEELLKNSKFSSHIKLVSLQTDGERFKAEFYFTQGYVIPGKKQQFKIGHFFQ